MATVGIIGLGLLGSAVAGRLRAAGHEVVGYDIVDARVQALVAIGGRAEPSAEAVARYPEKGPVLASGWLLGEEFLLDQANEPLKRLGAREQPVVDKEGGGAGDTGANSLVLILPHRRSVFHTAEAFLKGREV